MPCRPPSLTMQTENFNYSFELCSIRTLGIVTKPVTGFPFVSNRFLSAVILTALTTCDILINPT